MPIGSPGVVCMIEMTADGKPPVQKKDTEISHASQVGMQISSSKHLTVPSVFQISIFYITK